MRGNICIIFFIVYQAIGGVQGQIGGNRSHLKTPA